MFFFKETNKNLENGTSVLINNCVMTFSTGRKLNLSKLVWKVHGEFDPSNFAAAKIRLVEPATTALVFASGKVVCTGAASERAAFIASHKYVRIIRENVDKNAKMLNLNFQNIVASAFFGKNLDLESLYNYLKEKGCVVRWNPELFPGLHFQPRSYNTNEENFPKTFVVGFNTGKIVITGSKNKKEIEETWQRVYSIFKHFQTDKSVHHSDTVNQKRLKELMTCEMDDFLNIFED